MQAAADTLWRSVLALDREAARQRVGSWRRKYPKAGQAELHRRMVQAKCFQAGVVGALAAASKLMPLIGKLAGSVFGPLADATMASTLQAELVVETFVLYKVELPEPAEQAAVLTIAAFNLGTKELGREAMRQLRHRLDRNLGGKLLLTALPLGDIAAAAASNVALTYVVGQRAQALARMKDARLDEWPQVLRQLALLDEPKLADWAARAARDALGTVFATLAEWRERLVSLLPDLATVPARPQRRAKTPGAGAKRRKRL
jgi:GH24 family phage-related lysozyme (muramidase)